jgi:RimJ/RimL family protein N-acetyltransferase
MEFFPATLTGSDTGAKVTTIEKKIARDGFGFWAAELKEPKAFIGFIGLNAPDYPLPFCPCTEIGWRLAFDYWGHGYAQEGARAVLEYGFKKLLVTEIVSFTTVNNLRSRQVMEGIGMTYGAQSDFDHPSLPQDHPLRRHVLYRKVKSNPD